MTDLDTAIRERLDQTTERNYPEMQAMRDALLAVLDAHTDDRLDPGARPHCRECSSIAGRRVWAPCSTLRVIAEKLGAEHA